VQEQLTALHLTFSLVAKVNQHRDNPARMIEMHRPKVSDAPLIDIHANPQLVRLMFDFTESGPFFVNSILAIRDVTGPRNVNGTSLLLPNVRELLLRPVDKSLAVESLKQRAPGRLMVDEAFVFFIAPIKRETSWTAAGRARGKCAAQFLVMIRFNEFVVNDVRERVRRRHEL
jgi:hypothetical protein